ncbi:MAG: hypothetical protein HUJ65_02785 [Oscillospiraceae bacterium]|nr:hypothetical protein [Oscillospiraceae bacterium]
MAISNACEHKELIGKTVNIITPSKKYTLRFEDDELLTFSELGSLRYSCVSLEDGLFLLAFGTDLCVGIIDLRTSLATISMPDFGYRFGAIERQWQPLPTERHAFTDDLVGLGIRWYFAEDRYTNQVYFSSSRCRMSWAADGGIEKYENVPARYTRLRENVYLADLTAPMPDSIKGSDKYQRIIELMNIETCEFVGFAYGDNTMPEMVTARGEKIAVDPELLKK